MDAHLKKVSWKTLSLLAWSNPLQPTKFQATLLEDLTGFKMDGIELADFATAFDRARANDRDRRVEISYSGHLLLPADDVVITLKADNRLELKINAQPASDDHPLATLVAENDFLVRRSLRRNLRAGATRSEIIGRWHENGDEHAFEPYLVRTVFVDEAPVLHKYRYRIFPLDGYKLGDDFSITVNSDETGDKVKAICETSTETNIHFDDLPKSMFSWMPVGVVWSPPKKSGYPVLVEYAVGKKKRIEMRKAEATKATIQVADLQAV